MGNPKFAINPLKSLLASNHDIVAVISNPPKPMGRKKILQHTDVGKYALNNNLNLIELDDFDNLDIFQKISSLKVDIFVVVAFRILPKKYIELPKFGSINIHASLLPKYRGAAPIQRAIMAGDSKTGITIMQMDEQLDTGPLFTRSEVEITDQTTGETLHQLLSNLGADIINTTLNGIDTGALQAIKQPLSGASYASKLSRDDGHIDWNKSALEIEKLVRALYPWPGAWAEIDGSRVKIFETQVTPASKQASRPGETVDDNLTISCGKGCLRLLRLQKEGKKVMSATEYLNGSPISKGTKLS